MKATENMIRNKHTGEIKTLTEVIHEAYAKHELESLAELNEDWEDCKPQEPLIKDEKIRKAVRAWADVNRDLSDELIYAYDTNKPYCEIVDNQSGARICFNFSFIKELHTYEFYTITELCGGKE